MLLLLMISSVSAAAFYTNQEDNIQLLENLNGMNVYVEVVDVTTNGDLVFAQNNTNFSNFTLGPSITLGDQTFFYDLRLEFQELFTSHMIYFHNDIPGNKFTVVWRPSEGKGVSQNITLNETGYYFFVLDPIQAPENTAIYFDFQNDGWASDIKVFHRELRQPEAQGFTKTLFTNMIDWVQLISEALKIVYYVILLLIFMAAVYAVIGFIQWILSLGKKFRDLRERYMYK